MVSTVGLSTLEPVAGRFCASCLLWPELSSYKVLFETVLERVHEIAVLSPALIDLGAAVSVHVGGGWL